MSRWPITGCSTGLHHPIDAPGESIEAYAEVAERKELIVAFGEHLPGDPAKLAAAVLQIVAMEDPPLRLLLGQDVLHAFREKTAAWTAAVAEWEPLTVSMNFD